MTIIAIRVPLFFSLKGAVKTFVRAVQGYFEVLNFAPSVGKWKVLYIRLSPKLDAKLVVHRINGTKISGKFGNYVAHIPDPDNVPADLVPSDGKKKHIVPLKLRRKYNIPAESTAHEVVQSTHKELLTELQAKFTGLYNLSKKMGHQLLDTISQMVLERLECIASSHPEAAAAPPGLGRAYRRAHPHFGDFQMIFSTLHKLEDAARKPRTQVLEEELTKVCDPTRIIANSYESPAAALSASNKYSKKIIDKLSEHISGLQCEPSAADSEEEAARKLVRAQLRRIAPYLPEIVRSLVAKTLVPKSVYHRVNIYGEPNLPPKAMMDAWLNQYRPLRAFRQERTYNCLSTHIPEDTFPALAACDGDTVGPSKLVIRMMDHPVYTPSGDDMDAEEI